MLQVGGLLVLGARVLPLFGKTAAAAAARSRARKIDGGLLHGKGGEMALEWKGEEGGCRAKYRNIARVNLEAAKQKAARDGGGDDLSNAGEDNSINAQGDLLDNGERNHDSESYAGDCEPFQ